MARHKIQMIDDHRQTKEMAYITEHSACTNGRISSLSRSLITHQLTIALLLLQHYLLFLPFFLPYWLLVSLVSSTQDVGLNPALLPYCFPSFIDQKLRIQACYATEMETSHMGQKTECTWAWLSTVPVKPAALLGGQKDAFCEPFADMWSIFGLSKFLAGKIK